jgi:predicted nucleic acid-binding protein
MKEIIVSDSTCLIGLERINQLELLPAFYSSIVIPPAVQEEFGRSFPWLVLDKPTNKGLVTSLKLLVGRGESEAIALAYERRYRLIVDDRQARKLAQQMGIQMIGTVGILVKAKRQGIIPNLSLVLNDLEAHGFYLSQALKAEALKLVEE